MHPTTASIILSLLLDTFKFPIQVQPQIIERAIDTATKENMKAVDILQAKHNLLSGDLKEKVRDQMCKGPRIQLN